MSHHLFVNIRYYANAYCRSKCQNYKNRFLELISEDLELNEKIDWPMILEIVEFFYSLMRDPYVIILFRVYWYIKQWTSSRLQFSISTFEQKLSGKNFKNSKFFSAKFVIFSKFQNEKNY